MRMLARQCRLPAHHAVVFSVAATLFQRSRVVTFNLYVMSGSLRQDLRIEWPHCFVYLKNPSHNKWDSAPAPSQYPIPSLCFSPRF